MQIFTEPADLTALSRAWRASGERISLVPTMGYFHAGHLSLMRRARELGSRVVVTLFVNPTQFGPAEDLGNYPRAFERDAALAEGEGVDALFAPRPEAMYAPDAGTWVEVPELAKGLCGLTRSTHFRGVCTVVAKLFNIAQPDAALFGEKDWQQLAIIRRMVRDLNFPVAVHGCPIVREEDGLALSSRNVYLSPQERAQAPQIRQGLLRARELVARGETDPAAIAAAFREHVAARLPLGRVDYAEVVHPDTVAPLAALEPGGANARMAVAVYLGKARLIDNITLDQSSPEY